MPIKKPESRETACCRGQREAVAMALAEREIRLMKNLKLSIPKNSSDVQEAELQVQFKKGE
jgi:hypothetical protein